MVIDMLKRLWILGLALVILFASCSKGHDSSNSVSVESTVQNHVDGGEDAQDEDAQDKDIVMKRIVVSNMGGTAGAGEVRTALKQALNEESVEEFMMAVEDYNDAVEYTGLIDSFEERGDIEYDILHMSELWSSKKGDFIGTNCRLNSFLLLKRDIRVQAVEIDDSLLVFDNYAIEIGKILDEQDAQAFRSVFSRVKTENSKDVRIHAEKMKAHFEHISFNEKARMISVVIHDNLDGDFLFVGHVGILVEHEGAYLFVEKLAFDLPYQAIKFDTKEDCYRYLYLTYKHHFDATSAKPFIMDNGGFVEPGLYDTE